MGEKVKTLATNLTRGVVAIITVWLCVMMIETGGWWTIAFVIWLPVNFVVTAAFGDATPTRTNDSAETTTFGD